MHLEEANRDEWRGLCKGYILSSVYLDPRWLELIESVYPKLNTHRLVCRDSSGSVQWLLPLVEIKPLGKIRGIWISLPFGNYGGFILPGNKRGVDSLNIQPLKNLFLNNSAFAMELREITSPEHGLQVEDYFRRFVVNLSHDKDFLWRKVINGKARSKIRKADKMGVRPIFDHNNALDVFQDIYERNASYHGTPIHHVRWYRRLVELFPEETEIVLGSYEGKFIGALLLLHYGKQCILHLSVRDTSYWKIPVTDSLIWASCERIIEEGRIRSFDFGRTRPVPGKLSFKKKWGGREYPIFYSYMIKPGHKIPRILPENPKFKQAIWVWRHLPMGLKRSIGPIFRSRIPI